MTYKNIGKNSADKSMDKYTMVLTKKMLKSLEILRDEGEIGMSLDEIYELLELFLDDNLYSPYSAEVRKVLKLIKNSEFKRRLPLALN